VNLSSIDGASITLIPILHGKVAFAEYVRELCIKNKYSCIAVDLPLAFEPYLANAVDTLPYISAIIAKADADPVYFLPIDPCDASIEAVRQSRQNHLPFYCIGNPFLSVPDPLPTLPDEYAIKKLGFDAYVSLCLRAIGNFSDQSPQDISGRYIAHRLHLLRSEHKNILALVAMRNFARTVHHFRREETHNLTLPASPSYEMTSELIDPDHLYFALGELPFVTGKFERERQDPFAEKIDIVGLIKDLFRETRDQFHDNRNQVMELSPGRLQRALVFLRNLTVLDRRFIPTLFDIVIAAKGVGGNSFALHMLKCARYYPYFQIEHDRPFLSIGIDRILLPGNSTAHPAINLLRDFAFYWQRLSIKPDPSELQKIKYRYHWDPTGMCSHVPEDERIEKFNDHVRQKALALLREDLTVSEKFTVSMLDGLDVRETLSKWYTGDLYVKQIPPSGGAIDMVVIIFDDDHDELYPHRATWFAEHEEESTLTFYSTDPFENMIGPGVARSTYGGLSLLFPPRSIANIFEMRIDFELKSLAEYLTYGALLFSRERRVAYISKRKPGMRLNKLARGLKKHLVWVPISSFSSETLKKLRMFHVLNGKTVRSWAARFIGD
jgi:hypothetical protein